MWIHINHIDPNRLNKTVNKENFSGSILLKRKQEVIYEKAAGFADKTEERPNNIHTRFGIASGCKIFTAVAVCQLVEKGLLSFRQD